MVKVSLSLVESTAKIQALINKAIKQELNSALMKAATGSIVRIRNIVYDAIMNQPEVVSLDGGRLSAEFGLTDGGDRIEDIVKFWVKNITLTVKSPSIRNGFINSGLELRMIRSDYKDVLGLPESIVTTRKGEQLPWLEWLLVHGDKAIIRDYEITYDTNKTRKSRTGKASMIPVKGHRWSVPPEYSGTPQNNFVTRALELVDKDIEDILTKKIESSI